MGKAVLPDLPGTAETEGLSQDPMTLLTPQKQAALAASLAEIARLRREAEVAIQRRTMP